MIEVFKTNVQYQKDATMLLNEIHTAFDSYEANFDLEDCDNILRVKSRGDIIHASGLVSLLKRFGFDAAVLPDISIPAYSL